MWSIIFLGLSIIVIIDIGVPQEKVLGPLLFLIYINDIRMLPLKGNISLFADDTDIFLTRSINTKGLLVLSEQCNNSNHM